LRWKAQGRGKRGGVAVYVQIILVRSSSEGAAPGIPHEIGLLNGIGTDSTPTNRIRTGRRIINKHKSRPPCEPNRNTANLTVEHVSGHNAGLSGPK